MNKPSKQYVCKVTVKITQKNETIKQQQLKSNFNTPFTRNDVAVMLGSCRQSQGEIKIICQYFQECTSVPNICVGKGTLSYHIVGVYTTDVFSGLCKRYTVTILFWTGLRCKIHSSIQRLSHIIIIIINLTNLHKECKPVVYSCKE